MKVLLLAAGVIQCAAAGRAADYRIDFIEVDGRYVNIHFDTVANRTYALQYRSSVSFTNAPGTSTTGWSNLLVIPAVPFPNHHVVSDVRTNQHRYYRLRVTP